MNFIVLDLWFLLSPCAFNLLLQLLAVIVDLGMIPFFLLVFLKVINVVVVFLGRCRGDCLFLRLSLKEILLLVVVLLSIALVSLLLLRHTLHPVLLQIRLYELFEILCLWCLNWDIINIHCSLRSVEIEGLTVLTFV